MAPAIAAIVAVVAGVMLGFLVRAAFAQTRAQSAESRAQKVVLEAEREAEKLVREALGQVTEEIGAMRRDRISSSARRSSAASSA